MKLYKISQDENDDYATYDSAVVAAESEEKARDIIPGDYPKTWERYLATVYGRYWAFKRESVTVEYIGEAKEGTSEGPIVSSFNAG